MRDGNGNKENAGSSCKYRVYKKIMTNAANKWISDLKGQKSITKYMKYK